MPGKEPAVELGIHKEVKGGQKFSSRALDTLIKTSRLEQRPDFKCVTFLLKQINVVSLASFFLGPVARYKLEKPVGPLQLS